MSLRGTKRAAGMRGEDAGASKRRRTEAEDALWQLRPVSDLKMSSIYNRNASEAPAELFRKDLISAMKLPDNEPLTQSSYWIITDPWKQDWERGVQVPVNPDSLPAPKVKIVDNPQPPDFQEFKLPKDKYLHLTRDAHYQADKHLLSTTPARAEAACSYDLDATDTAWLKLLNAERARAGVAPVTEDQLEKVIEELEVQTWDKIQDIMKSEEGLGIEYDENVICDVCRSPDSEDGNEMVFCDSCNICVHQACYGITVIPDGQWLCRPCGDGVRPNCVLCPNHGGAMKCTPSGHKWAHVSCVLWIPEVSIGCAEIMEPITKISSIPASRWSLVCVLCRNRKGACIQCSVKTCKTAYHVTCAFKHGLEMRAIIEDENADDGVKLRSYCQKHSVNSKKEKCPGSGSEEEEVKRKRRKDMTSEEKTQARAARLHEIEREFDKHVSVKDISTHLLDVDQDAINYIYNYWKLKRRAGHNRPLLPPKSDDTELLTHRQEQADLDKMKMFVQLRQDLERVRNLCYMVSRREKLSRSFFRIREQTFHKQVAVLSADVSIPQPELNAILEANHGPSIYDRLYSHPDAPDHKNDFDDMLARIAPPDTSDEKKKDRNGLVKGSKSANPYKKHYVNGSRRSGSMFSGLSSEESAPEIGRAGRYRKAIGSSTDDEGKKTTTSPKKKVSPKTKAKKSPKKPDKKKKKAPQSKPLIESSSEDETLKSRLKKDRSRSKTLQQLEKEMAAGNIGHSGTDSDDLMPIRSTRNNKFPVDIYSDSSEDNIKPGSKSAKAEKTKSEKIKPDKSPGGNDSQQSLPRTKAAMKEFIPTQPEKKSTSPEEAKPAPKKRGRKPSNKEKKPPIKTTESDDEAKNKENIKLSKTKDNPTDLIVPQRQAAKKASENMRSTTVVKKDEPGAEKPPIVEEPKPKPQIKAKGKSIEVKDTKDTSPVKLGRKKSKESEKEPISYVPQRQAAKKAAAHIKSGLGTKAPVAEAENDKKKDDKSDPGKQTSPKKEDVKLSKTPQKDSSSSSSGSSSSSYSSSSSSEEEVEKSVMKPTAKAREIKPIGMRQPSLFSPPGPRPTVDLPFLDKVSKPLSSTSASSDSETSKESDRSRSGSPFPKRPRRRRKIKSVSTDASPRKAPDKKLKTSERLSECGVPSQTLEREESGRPIDARAATRARTRSTTSSGNLPNKLDAGPGKSSLNDNSSVALGENKTSKETTKPSELPTPERKADEEIKKEKEEPASNVPKMDAKPNKPKIYDSIDTKDTIKSPEKLHATVNKSSQLISTEVKHKTLLNRRMSVKDMSLKEQLQPEDLRETVKRDAPTKQDDGISSVKNDKGPTVDETRDTGKKDRKVTIDDVRDVGKKDKRHAVDDIREVVKKDRRPTVDDVREIGKKDKRHALDDIRETVKKDRRPTVDDVREIGKKDKRHIVEDVRDVVKKDRRPTVDGTRDVVKKDRRLTVDEAADITKKETKTTTDEAREIPKRERRPTVDQASDLVKKDRQVTLDDMRETINRDKRSSRHEPLNIPTLTDRATLSPIKKSGVVKNITEKPTIDILDKKSPTHINDDYNDKHWLPKAPSPNMNPPAVEKPGGDEKYMTDDKSTDSDFADKNSVKMIAKIQANLNENTMIKSPKTPMDARTISSIDHDVEVMARNIRKRSALETEKKFITQDASHVQGVEISKSAKIPSAVNPNRSLFSPQPKENEMFEFDIMGVDEGFHHDDIIKPFATYPEFIFKEDTKDKGVKETQNLVERLRMQLSSKKVPEKLSTEEPILINDVNEKNHQRLDENHPVSGIVETDRERHAAPNRNMIEASADKSPSKESNYIVNHLPHPGLTIERELMSRDRQTLLTKEYQPIPMTSNEKWSHIPISHMDIQGQSNDRKYDHSSYVDDSKEPIIVSDSVQSVSEVGDSVSLSKQSDDSQSLSVVGHSIHSNDQELTQDNNNYDNNNSLIHSDCATISSPYVSQDSKWKESKITTRRSSASSTNSEESFGSQKTELKSHLLRDSRTSNMIPDIDTYPPIPAYSCAVEPSMPLNQYSAYAPDASPFLSSLPLFGGPSQLPLPSPGPGIYTPIPYTNTPLLPPKPSFPSLCAAFTSSSQNIALTTAMIAPPTPKPSDSPRQEDIDVTEPDKFSIHVVASPAASIDSYETNSTRALTKMSNDSNETITSVHHDAKSSPKLTKPIKFPGKSPGKSPGISPKQNEGQKTTKRPSNRSNRTQRGRGRSKSRGQGFPPVDYMGNSIQSKLVGTVYDFDEEIANDGVDLKALRDRRKSVDVKEDRKSDYKEASQSPVVSPPQVTKKLPPATPPTKDSKPPSPNPPKTEKSPSDKETGDRESEFSQVQAVLPGAVDMRSVRSFPPFENAAPTTGDSYLLAFASGTADQQLADIDEEVEKQLHTELMASNPGPNAEPETAAPPKETFTAQLPKVSLSDSRNQLKVKIKGPFRDANYSAMVTPVAPPPPAATPVHDTTTNVFVPPGTSSSMMSGSGNLRRMRKKELLRQYWTQDMNMDDPSAHNIVGTVAPPAAPSPFARTVISIPKAITSMTSIPTREDYKIEPPIEKKKRKVTGGLSRELRHLVSMNADADQVDDKPSFNSNQHKRRGRATSKPAKPNITSPVAPKLKIKIGSNIVQQVNEEPSGFQFRPPKKRLIHTPSFEDLKRESMKYRRMVMADFEENEKAKKYKPSKSEKRKKKKDKKAEKLQVINSESESATKLIIKIKRGAGGEDKAEASTSAGPSGAAAAAPEPPLDPFEWDPTAPDPLAIDAPSYTEATSAMRKIRTAKVTPIRLKLARSSEGSGYVMKQAGDRAPDAAPPASAPTSPLPLAVTKHCEVR